MVLDPFLLGYTQVLVIVFKIEALVGLAAFLKISVGSLLLFDSISNNKKSTTMGALFNTKAASKMGGFFCI